MNRICITVSLQVILSTHTDVHTEHKDNRVDEETKLEESICFTPLVGDLAISFTAERNHLDKSKAYHVEGTVCQEFWKADIRGIINNSVVKVFKSL